MKTGLDKKDKGLAELDPGANLRERFLADPVAVGRRLGLGAAEARRLAGMSPRSFAASLQKKRLEQVGKLLPLTHRVLGDYFHAAFRDYADSPTLPRAARKHLGDALAFAAFLSKALRKERREPSWVLDVLRYELARVKASDPRRRVVVCYFRHDVRPLVRSLARKEKEAAVLACRCVAVWARVRRGEKVRYALFILPRLPRRK